MKLISRLQHRRQIDTPFPGRYRAQPEIGPLARVSRPPFSPRSPIGEKAEPTCMLPPPWKGPEGDLDADVCEPPDVISLVKGEGNAHGPMAERRYIPHV